MCKKAKKSYFEHVDTGRMYRVVVCSLHLCNYGMNIGWAKSMYSIYHVVQCMHVA